MNRDTLLRDTYMIAIAVYHVMQIMDGGKLCGSCGLAK